MRAMNRRRRVSAKETGSFWLSFSDMMSVLVLVFIFVIFTMMLSHSEQTDILKKTEEQYAEALVRMKAGEAELNAKEQQLILIDAELQKLTDENSAQAALLAEKDKELEEKLSANQVIILGLQNQLSTEKAENEGLYLKIQMLEGNKNAQQAEIQSLLKDIEKQKEELDSLGIEYNNLLLIAKQANKDLKEAQTVMSNQSQMLSSYQKELEEQQAVLEQMVGVKAQLIQALSEELQKNRIEVSVDAQTGAITLPSEMLFATGQNELSFSGMQYLDRFLPVYMNVLLSDEFRPYIAEIVIEGHTDSTGKSGTDAYLYNLELSQKRALSVSEYILDYSYMRYNIGLSDANAKTLRTLVTASGRSYSALIRNADGSENKTASRRVELKFRLKDDQTIDATEALLRLMGDN